jgi:antitoxin (DNA-binding transcriptional repressor) of toxin-antitoxin stability system
MRIVTERELRQDLSQALQHVQAGERLRIIVDGLPVADLVPVEDTQQTWVSRDEVERIRADAPLDPAFTADLRAVVGATVDEL